MPRSWAWGRRRSATSAPGSSRRGRATTRRPATPSTPWPSAPRARGRRRSGPCSPGFSSTPWSRRATRPWPCSSSPRSSWSGSRSPSGPLEKYLVDERLAGPAAAALLTIGGPDAAAALLGALDEAPRDAQLVLIQSLGEARSREAVPKILPFADSGDEGIRQAALYALANIGDPAAGPVLSRSRVASPLRERRKTPSLYLLYARRLLESGRTAEGLEAARAVLESYRSPRGVAARVRGPGPRRLRPRRARPARPPRRRRQPRPVASAARPSPSRRRSPGRTRPGRGSTRPARPRPTSGPTSWRCSASGETPRPCRSSARASAAGTRPCASRPSPPRPGSAGRPSFPTFSPSSAPPATDESAALKTALLGYPARWWCPRPSVSSTPRRFPAGRSSSTCWARRGRGTRPSASSACARTRSPPSAPPPSRPWPGSPGTPTCPVSSRWRRPGKGSDRARLQEAIVAVVRRNPDPERRADGLLDLLRDSAPAGKVAILEILPKVGGTRPLRAVVEETGSPDPAVQSAAVKALTRLARGGGRRRPRAPGLDDPRPGAFPFRGRGIRPPAAPVEPAHHGEARRPGGSPRPARRGGRPEGRPRRDRRRPRARVAAAARRVPRRPGAAGCGGREPPRPRVPPVAPGALALRPRGVLGPPAGRGHSRGCLRPGAGREDHRRAPAAGRLRPALRRCALSTAGRASSPTLPPARR